MNTKICGKLRLVALALVAGVFLLSLATGLIQAAPANPDSITVHTVRVFQNIFEDDDMLFVVSYDVPYASEPSEPASETFQLALYSSDGSTLLLSRALNYYQYNIHSLYADADAAASLTWESEYRVRAMGIPIYFSLEEDVTMDTTILSPSTHWIIC